MIFSQQPAKEPPSFPATTHSKSPTKRYPGQQPHLAPSTLPEEQIKVPELRLQYRFFPPSALQALVQSSVGTMDGAELGSSDFDGDELGTSEGMSLNSEDPSRMISQMTSCSVSLTISTAPPARTPVSPSFFDKASIKDKKSVRSIGRISFS